MSAPGERDITLHLYGLQHMSGSVLGDVFARKAMALISGLRDVDKLENGGIRFEYTLVGAGVRPHSEFALHEKEVGKKRARVSPSEKLTRFAQRLSHNEFKGGDGGDVYISALSRLCDKAGTRFDYGVIEGNQINIQTRIDPFMMDIINRIQRERESSDQILDSLYFKGASWGTFDGVLKEVDTRDQNLTTGYIFLSAGDRQVPCVFYVPIAEVGSAIDSRVVVEGEAVYDGTSPIPSRIEVRKLTRIETQNVLRWPGKMTVTDRPPWRGSESG